MKRPLLVLAATAAFAFAGPALADEPPAALPAPSPLVGAPTTPVVTPPVLPSGPAPSGGMKTGYLVGGIVCLGVGGVAASFGIVGLAAKRSSGFMDLSPIAHTAGGIALGIGGAFILVGVITLSVGASKASAPTPETSFVPTLHVGATAASAEWTF